MAFLDPKNSGTLICGLTADPELVNDGKIATFRFAIDGAGHDSENPDDKRGFFDGMMFLDDNDSNAKFVFRQISESKLSKGSQVAISYRLRQERYKDKDDNRRYGVKLQVTALTYSGSKPASSSDPSAAPTTAADVSAGQMPAETAPAATANEAPIKF